VVAFFVLVDFLLEVDFVPEVLELDAFFVVALVGGFLVVVFFRGVGFPASSASILSNSSISF